MFKKITLKNGLRILTVPQKNTKAAAILILVGTGSKYETKEINGISHFLEHLFFKGTKKRPSTLKIAESLDRVGGVYNAFTSKEFTGFWAKVESKNLDLALDWVSDILLNSKIEEKEIEKEKGVITEEINMHLDMPMSHIWDLWEELLYGEQPAGWPTIGEKENIAKFNRKNFLDYLKNHYSALNTVVCVAGNINSNEVEKKIEKYLKNISQELPKQKIGVKEVQSKPEALVHFKKTDQTHICLGTRGYNIFQPQRYAQSMLATILGGNMSSRLFISVRSKMGLAYYINTSSDSTTDTGYLITSAGVDHQNVEKAIELILKEYQELKEKTISEPELKKTKDYLKGTISLSLESSDAQASFYAFKELLEQKTITPEEEFSKIDQVSVDDIKKVAEDIFRPEKLNLALIGPFDKKEKFEKLLRI